MRGRRSAAGARAALNIALNNPRVGGDWDPDKLIDLLDELQSLPDFDATLTGFDEQQLRDLVLAPDDLVLDDVGPELDDDAGAGRFTIILEMPAACWPRVQPRLNALMADEPEVEVRVRDGAED